MLDPEAGQIFMKGLIKDVGEFLNPCGSRVQVSCPVLPVSGSLHSKAKSGRLAGCNLRQKKASLGLIVYQLHSGGRALRRL